MTWINSSAPANDWKGIVSSSSGSILVAVTNGGIYTSQNCTCSNVLCGQCMTGCSHSTNGCGSGSRNWCTCNMDGTDCNDPAPCGFITPTNSPTSLPDSPTPVPSTIPTPVPTVFPTYQPSFVLTTPPICDPGNTT